MTIFQYILKKFKNQLFKFKKYFFKVAFKNFKNGVLIFFISVACDKAFWKKFNFNLLVKW